jgi:filamentous hemagglutinin family protein
MKHAARTHKPLRPHPLALAVSRAFTASAMLAAMPLALAAPQGGTVTAGQAAIQHNGALTTITQGSQRAAIDWRSFNVGAAETVNFVQPSASSVILNRVVGNDPSAIFGRITANGQVMLINPNGILFGRTAQVDVGALTATTSNLSNADFMAGRLQFTEPGRPGATVENQGRITVAEGGFAALVGRQVANSGVITARLGKVALAGGDAFVLDLYGDKLVNLIVDPAALGALTDAQGQPLAARVDHSGQIVADGGRVQLSVATVRQLVDNLINLSGVVRASSFTQAPGVISLQGDAATRVNVSGTLDTSGESRGGRIEVTGREVSLQPGSSLAATGGQGSIAVGGDWQGRGPLTHAEQVNVAEGALLDAGGGTQGQGGTVVLWSGTRTQFAGRIAAGGGSAGGDGGQVEVSSKGTLGFQGEVDVFAANGRQGALLLDPLNLTIAATGSGDSQIAADQLRYFLTRGASVTLSADNNVTVDAEVNGLVSGGGGVAGGGLTLTAGNDLSVNQNIVLNNGALNLTATNGTLTQADGTVLYTGSGAANLRGGAGVDLGQVLSGGAVDIRSANGAVNVRHALVAATAGGTAAPLASLNVDAAGAVSLNGALVQGNATVRSANGAVNLAGAVLQSNAGNVQVDAGTTLTSATSNVGLVAGGTTTATAGGAIDLGVVISTGTAQLRSSGAGVTVRQAITGTGGGATHGVQVDAQGAVNLAGVNAGTGGISITATGNVISQGASAAEGGLVSAGSVFVESTAGQAGTGGAPLRVQAGDQVHIGGSTGVTAVTVLGRGHISLGSDAGSVTVSEAIAAEPGTASEATTERPTSVTVNGRTGIDLSGVAAGQFGVSMEASAGAITLRNSIFSDGNVNLIAQGGITLQDGAGVVTTRPNGDGAISMLSYNGTVTVGNAGIRAEGAGAGISLIGGAGVAVDGDVRAHSGTIGLSSNAGAVRVLASATSNADEANATLDAGNDATRSVINVSAQTDVDVGEMIAYNGISLNSFAGNVTLRRGLGGNASGTFGGAPVLFNTGYVDHARGYLSQYRPNVGRLVITAANGSVELNGLNLDGNANATDTTAGLSVTAGRRIVSNNEIAVNKGDIVLAGGTTQATDGVYLGSSVYSRGHDVVNNGVRSKTGYGIRITGRVLGMFDNTNEMAQLPVNTFETSWYTLDANNNPVPHLVRTDAGGFLVDAAGMRVINPDGSFQMLGLLTGSSVGDLAVYNVNASGTIVSGPNAGTTIGSVRGVGSVIVNGVTRVVQQQIAKIEIANNVANYQDTGNQRTLVEANTGSAASRVIELGTTTAPITIAGVANHTPGTAMRITGPTPVLTAPSQVPIISAPAQDGAVAAAQGIGLKLLSFREAGDTGSQVWGGFVRMINSGDSNNFFFRLTGVGGALSIMDVQSTPPVEGVFAVTAPVLAQRTFTLDGEAVTQVAQVPTGSATYTFQIEDGPNGGEVARLVSVGDPVNASLASLVTPPPDGATNVSAWSFTNWRDEQTTARVRLEPPTLAVAGVASGVRVNGGLYGRDGATGPALQSGSTVAPNYALMRTDLLQQTPFGALQGFNQFSDPRTFQIDRILVDSVSGTRDGTGGLIGTRVFAYDGAIETSNGSRTFDGNTGVLIPGLNGISGFNNSTVGFAGVGVGFDFTANGSAGGTGVGSTSGQGVGGAFIPGGQSGAGSVPAVDDRSSQDTAGGVIADAGAAGLGTGDVIFGSRPAGQADLGRGGAVPGSAVNVFKKRYRLATSSNASVCAPGVVQSTPAEGGAARECAGP